MFGTKASLIVDFFLVVQVLVVPALAWAILLVRKGKVRAHARIMAAAFAFFLMSVIAFEVDVHLGGQRVPPPLPTLIIHLCFSIPSLVIWTYQIVTAKRALVAPAAHRRRGKLLFGFIVGTVATGIWLYLATFT